MTPQPFSSNTAAGQTTFPGARKALTLLLLINLFNYLDRQVLAAVVDPIKQSLFPGGIATGSLGEWQQWVATHLGFKPELAFIGILSMAFMVTYMLGAPLFGKLAERKSRWMLIAVGVVLWSLASGASGLATTFGILLLTRCLVGIGEAAYGPVAPALISDFYPVQNRGKVLAWFYMAIPVGSALGYVLGGTIARSGLGEWSARTLGFAPESWRWAFYVVVIPGLILGAWSLFMREPPRGQADLSGPMVARKIHWRDYLVLLRTPSYVFCTLGMTAMTFAIGGIAFWMPYYLKHLPGAQGPVEVIFGGITCVAGLLGTLAGGMLGDKLRGRIPGSYFLVSGMAMLVGFPFMLLMLTAPFPTIWVLTFVTCFCLFFNTGPTNTILANVTHPSMRSAGFALNILIIHAFGDVISPVIIGILSDKTDMTQAFRVVGFMFLLASIFWLLGIRFLKRDTELAATRVFGSPMISSTSLNTGG